MGLKGDKAGEMMVIEDIARPNAALILMDSKGDLIDPIRGLSEIHIGSSSSIRTPKTRSRSTGSTSPRPISRKASTCSNTFLRRCSNSR